MTIRPSSDHLTALGHLVPGLERRWVPTPESHLGNSSSKLPICTNTGLLNRGICYTGIRRLFTVGL